jgi:hypothetical protein
MLPCWRQQSAWAVTEVFFCSDGEHEWMHLQKFRIIVASREVQKMLVFFFFGLPSRGLLKKVRTRNIPSGWSTEASDSPFQSCYSHHFWSLQTGTAVNEDMAIWGGKTVKVQTYRHSENLKLWRAIVHKVELNRTGYMLTLIGAVQSTGGDCLLFSGSQIAALTMPKQETSDWMLPFLCKGELWRH